jgi:cytochrome c-type biogenesis protein CcsB
MDLITLQNWLDNAAFAVLLITMLIYWLGAAFPKIPYLSIAGSVGMAIANLCLATLLGARWIEAGYFPLSNLYESLLFIAWGVTAMHFVAERMSQNSLIGAATAPIAMVVTAFATLSLPSQMQSAEPLVPALKSNWLMMHVSVMLLSYAALMVGALLAIAFLIITRGQQIELRGSSVGSGAYRNPRYRLYREGEPTPTDNLVSSSDLSLAESLGETLIEPQFAGNAATFNSVATLPIVHTVNSALLSPQRLTLADTFDNISYRMIGLGFPLLTIGIIAGGVWANEAWGSYWSWDPKETWALITWLVFAAYLHARMTRGWQGRRPAILAASGFVVVWICYLGVNLLGKGLHSYGWFF